MGAAIVSANNQMTSSEYYITPEKDRSNLFANLKVNNDQIVYYSGFAWKESGQYPTKASWEKYLKEFTPKINNSLELVFND